MQSAITYINAIDNALYAIEAAQRGAEIAYGLVATLYGLTREFGPDLFGKACVYTMAGCNAARNFYETHLRQRLSTTLKITIAIATIAGMVALVLGEAGWAWLKAFVREQYAEGSFGQYFVQYFAIDPAGDERDPEEVDEELGKELEESNPFVHAITCAPVDMRLWHRVAPEEEIFRVASAMGLEDCSNRLMGVQAMGQRVQECGWDLA